MLEKAYFPNDSYNILFIDSYTGYCLNIISDLTSPFPLYYNLFDVFKASTGILFKNVERFSGCFRVLIHYLMPTFREQFRAIHFIRAKSSLILSCPSERNSCIYLLFGGKGEEERGRIRERERGGKVRTIIAVIIF